MPAKNELAEPAGMCDTPTPAPTSSS
jgi:hypothetical protein